MTQSTFTALASPLGLKNTAYLSYGLSFLSGLLAPLGFAPFHRPGLTLLSLAILFALSLSTKRKGFWLGFFFGLGYFGLGVSWVIVSIHDYGQLNYLLSILITILFITYLSLFPALTIWFFKHLSFKKRLLFDALLWSTLWCLSEWIRANLFGGFPWLFIGMTQIDTPLSALAPLLGIYGLSILCAFTASLLALFFIKQSLSRYYYLIGFCLMLLIPALGKEIHWTQMKSDPISIGVIQANLSMRNKWDEEMFWNLLNYYESSIDKLLGKQLIILPESAIPLPASYLNDYLLKLHSKALAAKSGLMLGILQASNNNETEYYNSIISLGEAQGEHIKQHLVPFGEYIPKPFLGINRWLELPEPNLVPGRLKQNLIQVNSLPIASLICYEIAYPQLLRAQLPLAQWIVSISDNGWFGHSFASYQQLQMAQMLSLLTGRYQIVVNNDGLSSVINSQGEVVKGLPPFSAGILESSIFPMEGSTPWVFWYDYPVLIFCLLLVLFSIILKMPQFNHSAIDDNHKRGYPNASPSPN